ncbi:hypothetical protein R3P38DRAFT_1041368 [Favolaschia claudopus]|uniref:Uncharacterized protein n=1 Tax=Favolaschia claudopus TaxID=2862362 RepID=A0AAW0BJW2_9AGAR
MRQSSVSPASFEAINYLPRAVTSIWKSTLLTPSTIHRYCLRWASSCVSNFGEIIRERKRVLVSFVPQALAVLWSTTLWNLRMYTAFPIIILFHRYCSPELPALSGVDEVAARVMTSLLSVAAFHLHKLTPLSRSISNPASSAFGDDEACTACIPRLLGYATRCRGSEVRGGEAAGRGRERWEADDDGGCMGRRGGGWRRRGRGDSRCDVVRDEGRWMEVLPCFVCFYPGRQRMKGIGRGGCGEDRSECRRLDRRHRPRKCFAGLEDLPQARWRRGRHAMPTRPFAQFRSLFVPAVVGTQRTHSTSSFLALYLCSR